MTRIKCFLVEKTDKTVERRGEVSGGNFVANDHLWRRVDTGEEKVLRDFGPGVMWYADWLNDFHVGPDGRCLVVRTPGGDWVIDSRASNCTLPEDKGHQCWIRHGPAPEITVDKNGKTCGAGAGSIGVGEGAKYYHGFLRNGWLEQC